MTLTLFLMLLTAYSTLTGLVTEAIKKLMTEKERLSSNMIALVCALIIGIAGTAIYYQLHGIAFDVNNIIYMVLLGLASSLVAMVGYDKVKQLIDQLKG